LYARGLTVREIQGYLAEAYGTEVGHDLISTLTDGELSEVTAWQSRPLETVYPVVFFDARRVKIREENVVRNKTVYLALGGRRDGSREILGLWIETTEGAKFWMKVFNDLKTRGVSDILIAVTDGFTGTPVALEVVFPRTKLQTCIVHLIRNSLDYVSWKDRKPLAAGCGRSSPRPVPRRRKQPWTRSKPVSGGRNSPPLPPPGAGPGLR
jgi:putative transposase